MNSIFIAVRATNEITFKILDILGILHANDVGRQINMKFEYKLPHIIRIGVVISYICYRKYLPLYYEKLVNGMHNISSFTLDCKHSITGCNTILVTQWVEDIYLYTNPSNGIQSVRPT